MQAPGQGGVARRRQCTVCQWGAGHWRGHSHETVTRPREMSSVLDGAAANTCITRNVAETGLLQRGSMDPSVMEQCRKHSRTGGRAVWGHAQAHASSQQCACLCARPAQVLGGLGGDGGRDVEAVARRQVDCVLRGRKAPVVAVVCAPLGRVLHLRTKTKPHQRWPVSTLPARCTS